MTGRPRRCGWFDVPLLRYTATINGFDSLVVTKLDVLDAVETIQVCVAYERNGVRVEDMPATHRELAEIRPVYETMPGWKSQTEGISDWNALPTAAKNYLEFLESQTRCGGGLCFHRAGAESDHKAYGFALFQTNHVSGAT